MARRGGLFGASDAERESRLTQQRDYAAQLQEQVRTKQAAADHERARRRDEQQREREEADARAQVMPRAPAVPSADPLPRAASPQRSPPRSPQRSSLGEIAHGTALLDKPPMDPIDMSAAAIDGAALGTSSNTFSLTPLVPAFVSGPSIFDALLEPEPPRAVTSQLESLQKLRLEVEASWRQRRAALQTIAVKPEFITAPSPTKSDSIPLALDEKDQLDHEIELRSPRESDEAELTSYASGLLGESVLIPLTHRSPAKRIDTSSPRGLVPSSPPRSTSAVHRRLAAASAAAASASLDSTNALQYDSQLLPFE